MDEMDFAEKTLGEMLSSLGLEAEIAREDSHTLQLSSPRKDLLIGKEGDRLDDFQYLINRMVIEKFPDAPRIRVDCDGFKEGYEEELRQEVKAVAARVRETGKKASLRPLNSYYRKLAYDALADESGISASSPAIKQRYKRILIESTES